MSSLICEEDITKELQQFNVKFEDSDVPSRCKLDFDQIDFLLIIVWQCFVTCIRVVAYVHLTYDY